MRITLKFMPLLFLVLVMWNYTLGQVKVDEFIDGLSNDNLKYEMAKVGTSELKSGNKIALPKTVVVVKSVDVKSVLSKYKKSALLKRLIAALDDPNKDWYANILLYAITERDATSLVVIEGRADWVNSNKEKDVEYWSKYQNKKRRR